MARMTTSAVSKSTARGWVGDFLDREHMIPGGAKVDAAQFYGEGTVKVQVAAAGALAAAIAVPVEALSGAIPNKTVLHFGTNKFAILNAAAAAAAEELTTLAIPTALVDNDTAYYVPPGYFKTIPSGTILGRTFTERDAGTAFGPAVSTDDEIFVLVYDVLDVASMNDVTLYRPGSIIKENYLPGITTMDSGLLDELRLRYVCVRGGA